MHASLPGRSDSHKSLHGGAGPTTIWGGVRGNERAYSLQETKRLALSSLKVPTTHKFRGSEHYCAKFRMVNDLQKVDEAHNSVTGRTPADFQLEMKTALDAVGPIYAHIIMRCSEHKNPNRDRVFFEALYEAVSATCVLSMQPLISSGPEQLSFLVSQELGRFFRTDYYNIAMRRAQGAKLVDLLKVSELYELRHLEDQQNMSADLLASLYEKPKESGLHESYAATSGTIAKLLNRPQVKAQGTLGDKHWDRTRMELHMEPPAPDLGKKTTDVLASSPQDLRQLEDLRLTLLGKARPAQSRQPRASMAVHDVSGARPSMLLSRLNSAAQTGGTGTTGEGQGDSDGADGEDEDEGLSLEKIAGVVDGPGGGVLRKLNEMAGVGPG